MIRNYLNKFESEFNLEIDDEYEVEELPDEIEMCGYTWRKIGEINNHSLYLCDEIVNKMEFSRNGYNDWNRSDINEWLNKEFYNNIPFKYKNIIVKHNGDKLFLLSVAEYYKFINNISFIQRDWWLQSPGDYANTIYNVQKNGKVDSDYADIIDIGVRPAILLF